MSYAQVPNIQVGDVVDYHYAAFFGIGQLVLAEAVVTAVYDAGVGHVQLRYSIDIGHRVEPKRVSVMWSSEPVAHSWTRVIRSAQQIAEEAKQEARMTHSRSRKIKKPALDLDEAMAKLKKHRHLLIEQAQRIAVELANVQGTVTSTDVFREMENRGIDTEGHDKRWMGAVFSAKEWALVDYRPQGSHGRRVSVWARK